ncbi:MAG TPA: hypothetical protein VF761_17030 [Gemmatimonadaceae bacterium]
MALLFRLGPIIAGAALIVGFFTALWYLVLRPLGSGATGLYDEFLKAFRDADPNLRLIVASVMVLAFLAVIFWRPRRPVVNNADTSIDPFQLNILAGDGQRFTPRHVVYVNMLPAPTQFVSANHLTVYITRQHLIANTAGVPNIIVEVKRSNVPT